MYGKGERVLRIEAIVHKARERRIGRKLAKFPERVACLPGLLKRFLAVVRCVDAACRDDPTWDDLPKPSQGGQAGVDLNQPRMRAVLPAVLAVAVLPRRWGSAAVAAEIGEILGWSPETEASRQAPYDLKKLRGKKLIDKAGRRYYAASGPGLQMIAALAIRPDKVLKPVLAKATNPKRRAVPAMQGPIEAHYEAVQQERAKLCQAVGMLA
jgi:hypothetical protein